MRDPGKHEILIVDDDDGMRRSLARALRLGGYVCIDKPGGEEALLHLRQNPPPALILVDIRMPDMDGWTLLRTLRNDAALHAVPVVVVTGAEAPAGEIAALHPEAVLQKPFEPKELLETVHNSLLR